MAWTRAISAYAGRASAPFTICVLGDSVTEGTGSTAPTTTQQKRWVDRMRITLQGHNLAGITGGIGGIGTSNQDSTVCPWTYTGTVSGSAILQPRWLGKRGTNFPASSTGTVTLPPMTSLDVGFWKGSAATIPFTVTINGSATTVTPSTTGGLNNIGVQNITAGATTGGNNTVVLTANAGGITYMDSVRHYNGDETAGIRLLECGHYGWSSTTWTSDLSSNNNANGYLNRMPLLAPDLYIIFLGLNDYSNQAVVATFKSNIQSMISTAKAWHGYVPSFLLVSPYNRTDVTSPTIPLSSYRDALSQAAAADTDGAVVFTDMRPVFDATGGSLLQADGVHPTDTGHNLFGTTVAQVILNQVAPSSSSGFRFGFR